MPKAGPLGPALFLYFVTGSVLRNEAVFLPDFLCSSASRDRLNAQRKSLHGSAGFSS